jgi:hypothetical protein
MDWATEGWYLAQTNAYAGISPGDVPSSAYLTKVQNTARQRMAVAGQRLADLLNALLAPKATNSPIISAPIILANHSFKFSFSNVSGASFTILSSTNVSWPINAWSNLGAAVESPANSGQFQFTDPQATNSVRRFYRVRSP